MDTMTRLKIKLGESLGDLSKDTLFQIYLDDAESTILDLTNLSEFPDSLRGVQVDLAIIYYNKQGIEGQTSHNEGGISRNFDESIPEDIMKRIRSARKLPR